MKPAGGIDNEPIGEPDLGAIRAPEAPPSENPDDLTLDEQLELTPAKRSEYQHLKLVKRLEDQITIIRAEREEHKQECVRLRSVEISYEKLRERYSGDSWRDAGVVFVMAIGAAVMEVGSHDQALVGVGWTMILLPGIYQLGRTGFRTK